MRSETLLMVYQGTASISGRGGWLPQATQVKRAISAALGRFKAGGCGLEEAGTPRQSTDEIRPPRPGARRHAGIVGEMEGF
eukprot:2952102-Prymnesium_polylepis.3